MNTDVLLAGVGGQGVLSAAAIMAEAARRCGFTVKQGEIHGMSQRGGAVQATLRMSDDEIASDLIPRGAASMILSLEPVESLRHLEYLSTEGILITSSSPVNNIDDYPEIDAVLAAVARVPHTVVVNAGPLAREAGSGRADNVVMLGAASAFLPLDLEMFKACVVDFFEAKGPKIVELNLRAFALGREAAAVAVS